MDYTPQSQQPYAQQQTHEQPYSQYTQQQAYTQPPQPHSLPQQSQYTQQQPDHIQHSQYTEEQQQQYIQHRQSLPQQYYTQQQQQPPQQPLQQSQYAQPQPHSLQQPSPTRLQQAMLQPKHSPQQPDIQPSALLQQKQQQKQQQQQQPFPQYQQYQQYLQYQHHHRQQQQQQFTRKLSATLQQQRQQQQQLETNLNQELVEMRDSYEDALLRHQTLRFQALVEETQRLGETRDKLRLEVCDAETRRHRDTETRGDMGVMMEEVWRLRKLCVGLQVSVACVCRELDLLGDTGMPFDPDVNSNFHDNMGYPGHKLPRVKTVGHVKPKARVDGAEEGESVTKLEEEEAVAAVGTAEAVEASSWNCIYCTFANHGSLPHCELCEMPRPV
uniref:Adenylate cyclase, terminal-differentiation specific-like n=1 Tax=Petromyzon marinus TaxID=7757 RepID=A0AAJ7UFC8_PETMA|nr:adenylate cyclase, terminal-differentiation specific-like [Petromyzon marinus]